MGVKAHKPIYFNCHENPCLWGYEFCDRVIRRCLECDAVSSTCHTPRQQFNCTLYCDEITRSGETLIIERCDDGVHQLLYASIGINVLFAFILVLFAYILRLEIKAAVKFIFGKLGDTNQRPHYHVNPQDGENVETNDSGPVLRSQQAVRTMDTPGKNERSDDREETLRLNVFHYQQEESGSEHQQEPQRPNIDEQHHASTAAEIGNVRGELQSRLSAGTSHRNVYSPPGRHIAPATADTGYNSGNGIKDPV